MQYRLLPIVSLILLPHAHSEILASQAVMLPDYETSIVLSKEDINSLKVWLPSAQKTNSSSPSELSAATLNATEDSTGEVTLTFAHEQPLIPAPTIYQGRTGRWWGEKKEK